MDSVLRQAFVQLGRTTVEADKNKYSINTYFSTFLWSKATPASLNICPFCQLLYVDKHCTKDTASFTKLMQKYPLQCHRDSFLYLLAGYAMQPLRIKGQKTALTNWASSSLWWLLLKHHLNIHIHVSCMHMNYEHCHVTLIHNKNISTYHLDLENQVQFLVHSLQAVPCLCGKCVMGKKTEKYSEASTCTPTLFCHLWACRCHFHVCTIKKPCYKCIWQRQYKFNARACVPTVHAL